MSDYDDEKEGQYIPSSNLTSMGREQEEVEQPVTYNNIKNCLDCGDLAYVNQTQYCKECTEAGDTFNHIAALVMKTGGTAEQAYKAGYDASEAVRAKYAGRIINTNPSTHKELGESL